MIYDISPMISPSLAVFPGDVAFKRKVSMDFAQGDHLSLSSMESTLHLGSHADAPSHYHKEGVSIEQCSLDTYLGRCQVIDVSPVKGELTREKLGPVEILAPRILFKTNSIVDVNQWQNDFTYLAPELIDGLASQGVRLIGIDTPSMDHSQSKSLECHQAFFRNRISILEGLVLQNISPGLYILVALPLKIQGAEASPVRAVLLDQFNF
ncbi:MAG: cyclase family protein [Pseudobdellovibrionaceae bacterium]